MRRPVAAALVAGLFTASSAAAADRVDYVRQVKPVLIARCFACHGALQQKGGLRLDTARALAEGGDDGPAIVPGASGESPLIARVSGSGGVRMPPSSEGDGLGAEQIAVLRAWIDQGAEAPSDETPEPDPRDHWAFRAPVRAEVPPGPARNPIDAFLAAEWARRGLTPQPPAGRGLLLRRVYLDLIGLPPTDEELAAFVADRSPDAYEKVVDRLLASPQYGERWGRHWMDIWRYSDWWGLGAEVRNSQKHIWHWRDWIVESLNADKGYDQMLREMLAADELYPERPGPPPRDRLPRPALLQVQPQHLARGDGRAHRQGVPRPDAQLRQVPRPQVRPDLAGRLLSLPGLLRAVPGPDRRGPRRGRLRRRTASPAPSTATSTPRPSSSSAATRAVPPRTGR